MWFSRKREPELSIQDWMEDNKVVPADLAKFAEIERICDECDPADVDATVLIAALPMPGSAGIPALLVGSMEPPFLRFLRWASNDFEVVILKNKALIVSGNPEFKRLYMLSPMEAEALTIGMFEIAAKELIKTCFREFPGLKFPYLYTGV